MTQRWLRKLAFRFGYDVTVRRLPQLDAKRRALKLPRDMPEEFADIYARCREYTMTSPERMYALYEAVRHVVGHGIEGDFVECGVWKGGSAMLMAMTLARLGEDGPGEGGRRIRLYDTFAGMTRPTAVDVRARDGSDTLTRWEHFQRADHNAWAYAPLDEVRANMAKTGFPAENIDYVIGTVEETLPAEAPDRIALLRLDTDWYESTYHEMLHLFPRLAPGGVLVLDDYGSFEGARKAVDQYLEENDIRLLLHRVDTPGRVAVKEG